MSSSKSKYKICVSVLGRTIESLEAKVWQARRYNSDLIELRLDFVRNLNTIKLVALGKILKGNEVLTVRSDREGGKNPTLSELERIELISHAISKLEPTYVDVEIQTLRKHPDLIQEINSSNTKLIASYHDLKGTKNFAFLRKIILSSPLNNKSLYAVKIVRAAKTIQDNLEVLSLYSPFKKEGASKLIAFCTGRMGIPSRVLSLFLGSPYTYASLPGEPVASGQLDIQTMRNIIGMR